MQSPMTNLPFQSRSVAFTQSQDLARAVGCRIDDMKCMRGADPGVLSTVLKPRRGVVWDEGIRWFPIQDGVLVSRGNLTKKKFHQNLDVVLGTNGDEVRIDGSRFLTCEMSDHDHDDVSMDYEPLLMRTSLSRA